MKITFIISCMCFFFVPKAQNEIDLTPTLLKNNLNLIDIIFDTKAGLDYLEEFYKLGHDWRASLQMRTIIYDTSKAEHKKLLKGLKFNHRDTIVIRDWDMEGLTVPFNVTASKFKYNVKDSSLIFYDCQDIERHYKYPKPSKVVRKFKVLKIDKIGFSMLDMDFVDVKRQYRFKAIKK